jgi:hypothetical protein
MGGETAQLTFWDRPLHAMTGAFTALASGSTSSANRRPWPLPMNCFPATSAG